ncbi:MAG: cell division protein FtsZ [Candidatus Absconditabacteria bacterium]|nr:cell division protein FtsZ [Candidatus Absconditabacteria bacterium]MDD4714399.1 cell division protein FtsZ [Candidatus Absconditabacteria bacterium]
MVIQEIIPEFIPGAKIKVLGVGGSGNKAITRMIQEGLDGVEFVAINTDAQDLAINPAQTKVNIGLNITKGLGAGANPDIGRKAAEESEAEIKEAIKDSDMIFITAGMGGGTGTGAAPVIANIAKQMGILTIGIVTKPFSFEGKKRDTNSIDGLAKMKDNVDTLIVIPNDKIFTVVDKKTTFRQAFTMIDKVLYLGVQGISDLIIKPGDINIDFADIREVMSDSGNALLGIGYGAGERRAVDAARKAIENPLLETNLDGAKKVIFAVSGGLDLTPVEVQEAAAIVEDILDPDVNMIWGMSIDESFDDEVKVTIIATGFEEQSKEAVIKHPQRDLLGRPTINRKSESENFILRGLKSENTSGFSNQTNQKEESKIVLPEPEEDLETPAFITKRLNNEENS